MPSNHSLNVDRPRDKNKQPHLRDKSTIRRLLMYKGGKAIRNSSGRIVKPAVHQSWQSSGTVARVAPNQKWFGNTRTVTQDKLQKFQEELRRVVSDPTQVVIKTTQMPVNLLSEQRGKHRSRMHVLEQQPFETTFGPKAQRKKPNIQIFDYESLTQEVEMKQAGYCEENDEKLESQIEKKWLEFKDEKRDPMLKAGQSRRIYNELFKVIDSSDVLLQVVDVRDPMGTRSKYLESYLKKEKPYKHLVIILNKCDLVPIHVTKSWCAILSREYPTLSFRASMTHPFGKADLFGLLRQFSCLHADKKQISVGIVGYPNVGKSSLINALKSKKVCDVAPIAGETKVWQYISLIKGLYLIDCPGVVHPLGETDTELVLKNVVRIENIQEPESHIQEILNRVDHTFLNKHYKLSCDVPSSNEEEEDPSAEDEDDESSSCEEMDKSKFEHAKKKKDRIEIWPNSLEFLETLAKRNGKLLKGGQPDIPTVAKMVLNDWQRGRLPYYVEPPELEDYQQKSSTFAKKNNK